MIRCGVDLVLHSRILKKTEDERFLARVFHSSELNDKKKLGSIFALKEAVMKALGKKVDWRDIEIKYSKNGRPLISLSDGIKPSGFLGVDGSVSHDEDYVVGLVVIELENKYK